MLFCLVIVPHPFIFFCATAGKSASLLRPFLGNFLCFYTKCGISLNCIIIIINIIIIIK